MSIYTLRYFGTKGIREFLLDAQTSKTDFEMLKTILMRGEYDN